MPARRLERGEHCSRCDQVHTRCLAHNKSGQPCNRHPRTGARCCPLHGGGSQLSRDAADRATAHAEAVRQAKRFITKLDVDPHTALLDLVQYQAGVVAFWRQQVELVPTDQLTWGLMRTEEKQEMVATLSADWDELIGDEWDNVARELAVTETKEVSGAAADLTYQLLREASDDLARYAAGAIKAGVEERRVRLAESQAEVIAGVQQSILRRMFEEMMRLLAAHGVSDAEVLTALRKGWAEAVGVVVPSELRALAVPS